MNSELIDNSDFQEKEPHSLKSAISWWEKKRLWFNIAVGTSGIVAILISADKFNIADAIGLIMYGLFLNLLFSVGFLLEVFDQYYLKGNLNLFQYRMPLFLLGTIASSLITFMFTIFYYAKVI